jgi:quercetin dioxygenase-like cupin family protein
MLTVALSRQLSIIRDGQGQIGFKGEPTNALHPGDVINIPPGTLHRHGATPDQTVRAALST